MLGAFLGVFAGFVVLSEVGIARLLRDWWRVYERRWRSVGGFAGVDASSPLALSDEGVGAFVGDDLEVVRSTGVEEVDGRGGPVKEDDGPLFLSHGDVLGVVVPVIAENVELSLKFMGDGEYEGIVGGGCEVLGAEEGFSFGAEEVVELAPDERSDGRSVGHVGG